MIAVSLNVSGDISRIKLAKLYMHVHLKTQFTLKRCVSMVLYSGTVASLYKLNSELERKKKGSILHTCSCGFQYSVLGGIVETTSIILHF